MTAPLVTPSRDALALALLRVKHPDNPDAPLPMVRAGCAGILADALLASGVVLAADTLADEALVVVTRYAECHEEVSRGGESQPCNKVAVAVRLDPRDGEPYPVCGYHARADMVPLRALAAALTVR